MPRSFKSPDKNYQQGKFKTTKRPKSPSPKRKDYEQKALRKDDGKSRCTYVHPKNNKRCLNKLGIYPRFCELHTMLIKNLYVAPSQIKNAGNGLYAGPYGFEKDDIIGVYSEPWNQVSLGTLERRCKHDHCWDYVFCNDGQKPKTKCWDGLDIRSTVVRNANDAHASKFRNNAYFDVVKGKVYVIASRNIKPNSEIFLNYGPSYFK